MGNYSAVTRADLGGHEPRQDPFLHREAVQRRVLQRLQHARQHDAGGVDRRVRRRLGAAGQVDPGHVEQAAARGRHLVLQPAVRAELSRRRSGPRDLARLEQTTGRLTVAAGNTIPPYTSWTKDYSSMASASYVTGSHAIKTGMTMAWGTNSRTFSSNAQINTLVFNGGAPIAGRGLDTDRRRHSRRSSSDLGIFVQDTWTRKRLTLNFGARFDHFNAEVPAQSAAGRNLDCGAQLPGDRERARTGTTGRSGSPAPTTCSAPARRR